MATADSILKHLSRGEPIAERVVVVIAHPDDETVGLGGRLAGLQSCTLIQVTDGAPLDMEDARKLGLQTREAYAAVRADERDAAITALGASPMRLDYELADKTAALDLAGLTRRLARDLQGAEVVLAHAYEGGHPDHDAVAYAVQQACASMISAPIRLEFGGYHATPNGQTFNAFYPDPNRPAVTVVLEQAERARKVAALAAYATQSETLAQFPTDREAYRLAPTYDFTRPPPPGQALYDRWGWAMTSEVWRAHARTALRRLSGPVARPTVLSVAFPFAPVNADPVGGAEQVLSALDLALVEAGWRSVVVACEGSEPAGELIAVALPHGEIDDAGRALTHAAVGAVVREVVAREPVDLIHLHGIDFADYMPDPGPPVLVSLHLPLSFYPDHALSPQRPDTHLLPVSRAQAAAAPPGTPLLPHIENGVELDYPEVPRHDYALALGRIDPDKGFHLALDAARLAGVPLRLAGEVFPYAAHRAYFEAEIAPRLDEARCWVGPLAGAAKRKALAAARCVLIPSLAPETSSLVAREALAAGTPVIAFRTGALIEVVEDGVTGFLVDDVEGMAQAIGLAEGIDPAACRRAAAERFSRRIMTDAYLALYRRLIDGP